jgi:hypothetical protein
MIIIGSAKRGCLDESTQTSRGKIIIMYDWRFTVVNFIEYNVWKNDNCNFEKHALFWLHI